MVVILFLHGRQAGHQARPKRPAVPIQREGRAATDLRYHKEGLGTISPAPLFVMPSEEGFELPGQGLNLGKEGWHRVGQVLQSRFPVELLRVLMESVSGRLGCTGIPTFVLKSGC